MKPSSRTSILALLLGLLVCNAYALAEVITNTPSGVSLRVLNREVMRFRANLGTYSAEQRTAAAEVRIARALAGAGTPRVDFQMIAGNAELRIHGQTVFFILPADVHELEGQTMDSLVQQTVRRLDLVVQASDELRDRGSLLKTAVLAVLVTLALIALVWQSARNRNWIERQLLRLSSQKTDQIKSHTLRVFGRQNLAAILRGLTTITFWTWIALLVFVWLEFLLRLFPHTRPFGEQLAEKLLATLGRFAQSTIHSLPDLGVVLVVLVLARFASAAARRFFVSVTSDRIRSRYFDPTTAPIAHRLAVVLIWITAVIVAFPYIPGSQTPAFRGITVLAGLMITLGSGSVMAQLVGGLTMVYNRTCRPGDFVRIGDYEGTITSVGFFSSRLVTARSEEIVLPNSQISTGTLINYSRLNGNGGVFVPATVTIGYNTPWRQIHALLVEAARRTTGVKPQPAPVVLQVQLSDFYVTYELRVALETPADRGAVLSLLHANIQDVFNEYGVQIMSPHYRADPPQPAIVPKDKWHEPPSPPPAQP